jgi:hypothetical protein
MQRMLQNVESMSFPGIGEHNKAYPNRELYPREIVRTEQKCVADGKRCVYCRNDDTQRIINPVDLQPFESYYRGKPFRVYSCYLCGGLWHWEAPPVVHDNSNKVIS